MLFWTVSYWPARSMTPYEPQFRTEKRYKQYNKTKCSQDTSWFSAKLWDVHLNNKTQLGFIAKGVRGKTINDTVDMYDYLLFGLLRASLSTSLYSCAVKASLGSLFSSSWVRYMPLYGVKQGKVNHMWYVSPVVQSWSTWELHGVCTAWHEGGFH